MIYYKLGFAGMFMLCFCIPAFFISTSNKQGVFGMNNYGLMFIFLNIVGAIFMAISYLLANEQIKLRENNIQ